MTKSTEFLSDEERRGETAAEWLQHLRDKAISEAKVQDWLQWYGASEANRRSFDEMQTFHARLRAMTARQRQMLRASSSADRVVARVWRFRSAPLWSAAAALVLAVLLGLAWLIDKSNHPASYAATDAHFRTVRLADGSIMVLNAGAIAHVSYQSAIRDLEVMQGAAYFQVKRDPTRPFVVKAGDVSITAVGTAFSVTRDPHRVSLTVTEGSVDVAQTPKTHGERLGSSSAERRHVRSGERAQIDFSPERSTETAAIASTLETSEEGALQFFNTPLGQVVEALNAESGRRIQIDDPRVTELNYSGTVFRPRIDEWLAALPQIYPVRSVPLQDGSVTLVLRSAP